MTLRLTSGFAASLHSIIAMSPCGLKAKTSEAPEPGKPNSLIANTSGEAEATLKIETLSKQPSAQFK